MKVGGQGHGPDCTQTELKLCSFVSHEAAVNCFVAFNIYFIRKVLNII